MRVVQMRPTPNLLHYLLTRYDLAGVLCENLEDKIFLRAKDKPLAVECPGAGGEVDFKQSDSDDRIAGRYQDRLKHAPRFFFRGLATAPRACSPMNGWRSESSRIRARKIPFEVLPQHMR